jgi:alcohol dehydrogenase/L-iditol 2-dehydrogenase
MELVARNGQITKIGWGPKPVEFSLDPIIQKAARLQGTFSHTWRTWEAVLSLIASGGIQMEPMVTHVLPITEWEKAYHLVEDREAVKVVLQPE